MDVEWERKRRDKNDSKNFGPSNREMGVRSTERGKLGKSRIGDVKAEDPFWTG